MTTAEKDISLEKQLRIAVASFNTGFIYDTTYTLYTCLLATQLSDIINDAQ